MLSPPHKPRSSLDLTPTTEQVAVVIERLIQYMTRCPFSLSRLVKVSDTGQVVYQAEKQACRAFPDPNGDGTQAGGYRRAAMVGGISRFCRR